MSVSRRHRRAMPATFAPHAIGAWLGLRIRACLDAQLGALERQSVDAVVEPWRNRSAL